MCIVGQKLPDGTFTSRLTAEYPPSLAAALATLVISLHLAGVDF